MDWLRYPTEAPGAALVPVRMQALAGTTAMEPRPSVGARTSARPTYAPAYTGWTPLPRAATFRLIGQFHQSVPIVARALQILAGFTGAPTFKSEDEALADDLNLWAASVAHGHIGYGLKSWIPDFLTQALLYGYAIGEMQADPARSTVERLWAYRSPCFDFEAEGDGQLRVVQPDNFGKGRNRVLDSRSVFWATYQPEGCAPQGRSLILAGLAKCQGLLDAFHAHRATWRRSGIPTYHVNWLPYNEETFDDPDGVIATEVVAGLSVPWNQAMKSQVLDGVAEDLFTTGKISISAIGADIEPMDIEVSSRAFSEHLIALTGIPPFLLGMHWSTTERLSQQQADLLMTTIDTLRWLVESPLRRVVETRQRLAGQTGEWEFVWPDVSLQDRVETAKAALADAQAKIAQQKYAERNWQLGIWNQEQVAEHVTGEATVDTPMNEPPPLGPELPADDADPSQGPDMAAFFGLEPGETVADLVREVDGGGDYGDLHAGCQH